LFSAFGDLVEKKSILANVDIGNSSKPSAENVRQAFSTFGETGTSPHNGTKANTRKTHAISMTVAEERK
jgi:hypothetical protein